MTTPASTDDASAVAGSSSGGEGSAVGMEPVSRFRWVMIGLAFLATVINYLDRQTLSVLAPILSDEFQMSSETYGSGGTP